MTAFSPVTESRIRDIQTAAAERRRKREEAAAELAERKANEEQRTCVSPRDVELAAAHKAACEFWEQFHEREALQTYHKERRLAIKEMARLKNEWDQIDTTPTRRGHIVHQYGELYRRFEDDKTRRPTTTSDEAILKYWESEKRKAALARIYGVTKCQ
jgi:hypothetical protein